MLTITRAIVSDLLRNWSLWLYTFFLLAASFGLFLLEGHDDKLVLSILNMIILLVPAFSLLFSIMYYFNSIDFILLLLAQPIKRKTIILSFVAALALVFILATIVGIGFPLLVLAFRISSLMVICVGIFLSVIFVILAVLIGVHTKEKSRGLGLSLVLWFYFILIFDGMVLLMMYLFSEYPVEKIALYITFLNPVDLGRIMTLMYTDAAALMGYTGAVFQKFFDTLNGTLIALSVLGLWVVVPAIVTVRKFAGRNF